MVDILVPLYMRVECGMQQPVCSQSLSIAPRDSVLQYKGNRRRIETFRRCKFVDSLARVGPGGGGALGGGGGLTVSE